MPARQYPHSQRQFGVDLGSAGGAASPGRIADPEWVGRESQPRGSAGGPALRQTRVALPFVIRFASWSTAGGNPRVLLWVGWSCAISVALMRALSPTRQGTWTGSMSSLRLLEHPYRSQRPQPETFSAQEHAEHCVQVTRALLGLITEITDLQPEAGIVDLASARAGAARVIPKLTGERRNARHSGTYSHDVSAAWIARHLLHDLGHHVLDIRCGFAGLALADLPGDWNAGRKHHAGAGGIRPTRLDDADRLGPLFDSLGYPASSAAIRARLARVEGDPAYESWVAPRDGELAGFAAGHLVHPFERDRPAAQLVALAVAPTSQRTGVGAHLCRQFEQWAGANRADRLIVTSGEDRRGAHAFYERMGYDRNGVRFGKALPKLH